MLRYAHHVHHFVSRERLDRAVHSSDRIYEIYNEVAEISTTRPKGTLNILTRSSIRQSAICTGVERCSGSSSPAVKCLAIVSTILSSTVEKT